MLKTRVWRNSGQKLLKLCRTLRGNLSLRTWQLNVLKVNWLGN